MDTRHVDQALTSLGQRKTAWARLPIRDKIGYLKEIRQLALTHARLSAHGASLTSAQLERAEPAVPCDLRHP